jgi:hypothetical protein
MIFCWKEFEIAEFRLQIGKLSYLDAGERAASLQI